MSKVTILKLGVYNRGSIFNWLWRNGCQPVEECGASIKLDDVQNLIIPGVSTFEKLQSAFQNLDVELFREKVSAGELRVIAICAGMQFLFESSEESPGAKGLGLLKGHISKLQPDSHQSVKSVNIGWRETHINTAQFNHADPVHSFYYCHKYGLANVELDDVIVGKSVFAGVEFASIVKWKALLGVQFHPEISGFAADKILQHFDG